ncbi:hypothetical protein BHC57_02900 [Snodgrassella alvi]|jgi:hypothetical protein|uniref:Uncharacterized protein n=1 Tax=Snodgrassella alvi TaxID=1196083 RepID=A0A855FVJ9_9NEIS|nr:hypothetical protein BHC57_02900 [Snodgrassella alvi]
MLIDEIRIVTTNKISVSYSPNEFPYYKLIPNITETGKKYCLFFYVDKNNYLILATGIPRYKAIQNLKRLLETAHYQIYEVHY